MSKLRTMKAIGIGLWALNQPRWICNAGQPVGKREDWQGHGKRKKPKIK